jgi:hypothetical protein
VSRSSARPSDRRDLAASLGTRGRAKGPLATRAPLCLLMRCIIAFPVAVGLITAFLRSIAHPVSATGESPGGVAEKDIRPDNRVD